jgi:hypothetical protein
MCTDTVDACCAATVEALAVVLDPAVEALGAALDPPLPDEQAAATTATAATIRSSRLGPCISIASQE